MTEKAVRLHYGDGYSDSDGDMGLIGIALWLGIIIGGLLWVNSKLGILPMLTDPTGGISVEARR
jgi:hypothetical protein